jgi:hypothetical protein
MCMGLAPLVARFNERVRVFVVYGCRAEVVQVLLMASLERRVRRPNRNWLRSVLTRVK